MGKLTRTIATNPVWGSYQVGHFYSNQQRHTHGQTILELTEWDLAELKDTYNMYRITTIGTPNGSYQNTFLARIDIDKLTIQYNVEMEGEYFKPSRKYIISELIIQKEGI